MSGSRRSTTQQSKGRSRSASSASAPVPDARRSRCRRGRGARRCSRARVSLSSMTSSRFMCGPTYDLSLSNALSSSPGGRRLHQVGERAVREAVLPLLLDGEHLHRDVARARVELEVVEHRPAEHVRQEDVERDRRRQVLAGEGERLLAAVGDDGLEPLAARDPQQDARVVRVVLDDQERPCRRRGCFSRSSGTVSSTLATESTGTALGVVVADVPDRRAGAGPARCR